MAAIAIIITLEISFVVLLHEKNSHCRTRAVVDNLLIKKYAAKTQMLGRIKCHEGEN